MMARIRSIKPEFASDGDMLRLSDSCALFFILLWNFCDDEGKHPFDLDQLVGELGGRWHRGKVKLFASCLIKSGQLRLNSDSTWIQVTGWSHQRIDKPKQPNVRSEDLQWLTREESSKALERSRLIDARIGSDRIREDRIGSVAMGFDEAASPRAGTSEVGEHQKPKKKAAGGGCEPDGASPTALCWRAYRDAFADRYGKPPPWNAKIAGQLKLFVSRMPAEVAPSVAAFYVGHNGSRYTGAMHPTGLMLLDAEKLHTEWATGRQVTNTESRQLDRRQSNFNAFAPLLAEAEAREREERDGKH